MRVVLKLCGKYVLLCITESSGPPNILTNWLKKRDIWQKVGTLKENTGPLVSQVLGGTSVWKIEALFSRSVKNFVRRACFCFFNVRWKFFIYAESFLRSKVCLKKQKYTRLAKFLTLRVSKNLMTRSVKILFERKKLLAYKKNFLCLNMA